MSKQPEGLDISMFWLKYEGNWMCCARGDCLLPVMPELQYSLEPTCFWHGYLDTKGAKR